MAASVALLFCSAALVAVETQEPFRVVSKGRAQFAGVVFAACGLLNLLYVWSANRFRVSLGRLMVVVAFVAVILQGVLIYRHWLVTPLPKPGGTTTTVKTKSVPMPRN
jgi:hypothetical protein